MEYSAEILTNAVWDLLHELGVKDSEFLSVHVSPVNSIEEPERLGLMIEIPFFPLKERDLRAILEAKAPDTVFTQGKPLFRFLFARKLPDQDKAVWSIGLSEDGFKPAMLQFCKIGD